MGYINIKITDIEIPNNFLVYYKQDDGSGKPYPINGTSWVNYGALVSVSIPIFTGGTTTIMLSGSTIANPDLPNFQYGKTYWVKLQEYDYPDRYVIKNIRIFDSVAFGGVEPLPTPTLSPLATRSVTPSITRTTTPSLSISATPSMTRTPLPTPSITPSISVSSSTGAVPSPSMTKTPSITPSAAISEIYFASISSEIASMGVNNPGGRTFTITFNYHLNANCDNVGSNGQSYNNASTYLFVSENNGSSWTEVTGVTVSVNGGTYPVSESATQDWYGTYIITGITDVSQVKLYGQYDCVWTQDAKSGGVDVIITNVVVNTGTATIICNDSYHVACLETGNLYCSGVSPSPSITPSSSVVPPTPSPSPEVIPVAIYNNSGNFRNITGVSVGEEPVFDVSPDFPLYPGDNALGRSPKGTGTWNVVVNLISSDYSSKKMTLIDSLGNEHCQDVAADATQVNFFDVYLNTTGIEDPYLGYGYVSMVIEFFNGLVCPPPPSATPSITPSLSKSNTPSTTPGLSPTRTPSTTPTIFGYYGDVYICNVSTCGGFITNVWIQSEYYLTIGQWYKYDENTVYYITSEAPIGGDVIVLSGYGFTNCNDACAS